MVAIGWDSDRKVFNVLVAGVPIAQLSRADVEELEWSLQRAVSRAALEPHRAPANERTTVRQMAVLK